jgi:hypothetical protein
LRQIQARALQQARRISARPLAAAAGLLLLAACANEGIWPTEPLPPAPAGPPPPAPSFNSPHVANPGQPEVLTNIEREELEARLSKLAKDREAGVQRRIQMSK